MSQLLRIGLAVVVLSLGAYSHSYAQSGCTTGGTTCGGDGGAAPEIDPSMTGSGAVLLGGIVLLVRSRRRR